MANGKQANVLAVWFFGIGFVYPLRAWAYLARPMNFLAILGGLGLMIVVDVARAFLHAPFLAATTAGMLMLTVTSWFAARSHSSTNLHLEVYTQLAFAIASIGIAVWGLL